MKVTQCTEEGYDECYCSDCVKEIRKEVNQ